MLLVTVTVINVGHSKVFWKTRALRCWAFPRAP